MFQDQVFCFTPRGDLIGLPQGATVVDLAYAVHSEVGDHCVGAKVNGRMQPVRTVLANGDQVEILTARNRTPSPEWERFVVTGRARARIRRMIRLEQRDQYISLGREIARRVVADGGRKFAEKALDPALEKFGLNGVEDLYAALGEGLLEHPPPLDVPSMDMRMMWHPRHTTQQRHRALRTLIADAVSGCAFIEVPPAVPSTPA